MMRRGRSFGSAYPTKRKKLVEYWLPSTRPIPPKIVRSVGIGYVKALHKDDTDAHVVDSTSTEMKTPLVTF